MGEIAVSKEDNYIIPMNVGAPKRFPAKLTAKKRKIVLESLSKEWNVSLAASKVGCSAPAIDQLRERDPVFKAAYKRVERAYLDKIEGISVSMALDASRDGFPDRKLQLQSRRKNVYGIQPEVQTNIQINIDTSNEMKSILSRIMPDND